MYVLESVKSNQAKGPKKQTDSWFERNKERDVYLSLLHLDEKVDENILKMALLLRAKESARRIFRLREQKQSINALIQSGSVDDELMEQFADAEKEVEAEVVDIVNEANAYVENWGQQIFQTATEMCQAENVHKEVERGQERAKIEQEWWESKDGRKAGERAKAKHDKLKKMHEEAEIKQREEKERQSAQAQKELLLEAEKEKEKEKKKEKR